MSLEISAETEAQLLQNARAHGLEVEAYLRWLMAEDEAEFVSAVEEGLRDADAQAGFVQRGKHWPISV